jgi:prepilin-type N-terminal cleavage/methylation domain-containing protein
METDRRRRDQGFTLVELLVVMVLMGVVGGVVVNAVTTSLRSASSTTARVTALHELEIGLQRITRDLRAADPLVLSTSAAYATDLGAEIDRSGSRREVRFTLTTVDGQQRVMQMDTGQTLVTEVDNGPDPIFRYLDAVGDDVICTTDCAEKYLGAAQIEVRLVRNIPGSTPVQAETRVAVRSIRYGG